MIERRLRAMQLAIAAVGFAGVIAELVLHEHWAEPLQVVPFFLCGAGIGMVQHLRGNLGFEREIFPEAPLAELLGSALNGVAPLLAPGGIALGALIAGAATYRHPAIRKR